MARERPPCLNILLAIEGLSFMIIITGIEFPLYLPIIMAI
jgi:hypothetical protein